jgi:hypothetical protein
MVRKNASSSLGREQVARLLSVPLMDKGQGTAYRDHVLISTFTEGYTLLGWHHWYDAPFGPQRGWHQGYGRTNEEPAEVTP